VGGGFGGKCLWSHHVLAAAAARLARRPVRMTLPRDGVFSIVGGRTTTEQRVVLGRERGRHARGADPHRQLPRMTAHKQRARAVHISRATALCRESIKVAQEVVDMDMLANTFMRAPGESVGTFALECAIDELAEKLGLDPIELRCRIEPVKDPTSGHEFSARNLVQAYREGALRFAGSAGPRRPRSRRDGDWLRRRWGSRRRAFRTTGCRAARRASASRATAARGSMRATRWAWAPPRCRRKSRPTRLGLPVERVRFRVRDTDLPAGTLGGGSSANGIESVPQSWRLVTSSYRSCSRIAAATRPLAGLKPSEVEARDGGLLPQDATNPSEPRVMPRFSSARQRDEVVAEVRARLPLEDAALVHAFLRRAILRGARERDHRRDTRDRGFSVRSIAANPESAKNRPRQASSAAASSWDWASRCSRRLCF
jgi:xanthine dehydrogenase YagR molybdenum-binding subunit